MLLFHHKLTAVLTLWLVVAVAAAELQRFKHVSKGGDGPLSAVVVGDWGRRGTYNQSEVAVQMGRIGAEMEIDFVISTGDNFYTDGLTGVDDPAFDESFSDVYTAPSLQKQWYSVLGNHDYRGNVLAQLSPVLKDRDSRWFCLRSYIVTTEFADFFFVDTTPFQDKYFFEPEDHTYDWRGVIPRKNYLSGILTDLDLALKESTAKWKIVVGHHTIRSFGHHGDTIELVHNLLPILQANDVDIYLNGHDHCLQHIGSVDSSLQFLTSGGGSKAWRGDLSWSSSPMDMKFYYDGQGFMTLQIDPNNVGVTFYDVTGNVLHKWNVTKPMHSVT